MLGGLPALVREEWRLVAAAAVLFFGPLLALIAVLQVFPEFVHYLLEPGADRAASTKCTTRPTRRLGMREADTSLVMFGFYIWNNVRIGFQTFAGGLAFGVGSVWFLAANGVIIGAVAGYLTQIGYARTFWSFVAGHSSLELHRDRALGRGGPAPGPRGRSRPGDLAARPRWSRRRSPRCA